MTASLNQVLTLEEFLKLLYLEDLPAWEYVDGVAMQVFAWLKVGKR